MREIGIRKVLGAGTATIVRHLTSDFAKLILIANLVAWPISWWVIDDWLNSFVYRMEIGVSAFLMTGVLAFVTAGVMIGYHTYKAASREPVDTIRR
jgi:putative ABC transport system permease protein